MASASTRRRPDELKRAVNAAMDSGKPTLINAVIDPAAGSESGRIGNLNPQSKLQKEKIMRSLAQRIGEENGNGHAQKVKKPKGKAKAASRKVVKLEVEEGVAKKKNGNALPRPSSKPYGQDGKALTGVRILDFTHVQSGPTCTQLLAWLGADVIKVERPGIGDITRGQLVDVKGADSLYFTMLNHNKRSITIDSKHPQGKRVLNELIKKCDVLVENFAPGALDRMGLTWEHIHSLNPRMIVASVKGFGPGPYEDCKVYENVAQCTGGSASTTGFRDGPPLVTGSQIGDSGTGLHLALGIVSALFQRNRTGRGQKVLAAMQDGVLNLCRVKLRDQQRLKAGPLTRIQPVGEGIRSATPRRAPATIPAAASRAGSSSAKAGRPIPTPTSISSRRRRCGRRSATSSASRPGRPIRNMPRRRRGCRSSRRFSRASNSGP